MDGRTGFVAGFDLWNDQGLQLFPSGLAFACSTVCPHGVQYQIPAFRWRNAWRRLSRPRG